MPLQRAVFNGFYTQNFYTQTLLHRSLYPEQLLELFTEQFDTQKLLRTGVFAHRSFYAEQLLH